MGVPFMIVSGVLGAASSIYQGQMQARAYEAQAAAADSNRRTATLMASESLKEGAREEERFSRQARQFAASQESRLAASGAQLSGSPLSVLADTASGIEEDTAMIRYNTLKSKWGYDVQAVNSLNEANAARSAAKGAKTAGYIGAASSILGTAANVWSASPVKASAQGGVIKVNSGNYSCGPYSGSISGFSGFSNDWWGGKKSRTVLK